MDFASQTTRMICFCHWVPEPALSGIALQPHMHEAESVTQGPKCSFQALPCSLLSAQGFGLHSLQVMQHTPTFTVPRFEEQKTQVCGVLNIHAVSRHYITKAANILFELLSHNSDARCSRLRGLESWLFERERNR